MRVRWLNHSGVHPDRGAIKLSTTVVSMSDVERPGIGQQNALLVDRAPRAPTMGENVTMLPTAAVDSPSARRRSARQRFGWVVALLLLIGVAGGAWWVGASTQSPDQAAAKAQPPEASWVTAPVEFRVLSSTVVTRGDVEPEAEVVVQPPVSVEGDPVLTRVVLATGDVVAEGDRVVEVSGRPVFLMQGDVAVYRTLRPGMFGDDVAALQESLVRLGFTIADDGVFGEDTESALTEFYSAAGYEPIATSETFLADLARAERAVTDAAAAVEIARRAMTAAERGPEGSTIAAADAAVAEAGRSLGAAQAAATTEVNLAQIELDLARASRADVQSRPDVSSEEWNAANVRIIQAENSLASARSNTASAVASAKEQLNISRLARAELGAGTIAEDSSAALESAERAADEAANALRELKRVNGPTVPQGEIVFVSETPARVLSTATTLDQSPSESPGAEGGVESLVSLATGELVVTGSIRPDEAGLVRVGLVAELLDELTDTRYEATVSSIASEGVMSESGQLGHPITITPIELLPDDIAGTNVRVTLTAASTDTAQLVVPVAAVSSTAAGVDRVNVLDVAGEPVEIEIVAGLSADGFIAIEPVVEGALTVDTKVIVGR